MTNNKLSEGKIKTKIQFTKILKRIKCLVITLTKKVKDFYTETWTTLIKEIEDKNKKIFCVHGLEELISLKCP